MKYGADQLGIHTVGRINDQVLKLSTGHVSQLSKFSKFLAIFYVQYTC